MQFIKFNGDTWLDPERIVSASVVHGPSGHAVLITFDRGDAIGLPIPGELDHDQAVTWLDQMMRALSADGPDVPSGEASSEDALVSQAEADRLSKHGWEQGYDQRDQEFKDAQKLLDEDWKRLNEEREQLAQERRDFEWKRTRGVRVAPAAEQGQEATPGPGKVTLLPEGGHVRFVAAGEQITFADRSLKREKIFGVVEKITSRMPMSNFALAEKLLSEFGFKVVS